MHWEKKICFRVTTRRIVGAILTATTVVNMVIVGAAFEAAAPTPTATATVTFSSTAQPATATTLAPTTTVSETSTATPSPSATLTPTDTPTDLPTFTVCILMTYWPSYRVRPGDTLYSLARATGSTADELRLANCLPDYQIYAGQILYVPRLPGFTATPSSTATDTPSSTATDTPAATSTYTPITPTPTGTYTPITPSATSTYTPYLTVY
ncbi:MAG TPA: LysM peptidoglycan-binding domain-containing protein [Anaerolineales bacterium]|nr:LysM peptidoglycan-binding domain-containing protein [Anaerolineales bacterium]